MPPKTAALLGYTSPVMSIAHSVLAQSEFLGRQTEVLLFVAAVYWVFAYALSAVSRRIEAALGVGER